MHQICIDEQNIPTADRKGLAVDVGRALALRQHQQFTLLMPVGTDPLCPGRIRGEFVHHQMKAHVAVRDGFVDQIKFLGIDGGYLLPYCLLY